MSLYVFELLWPLSQLLGGIFLPSFEKQWFCSVEFSTQFLKFYLLSLALSGLFYTFVYVLIICLSLAPLPQSPGRQALAVLLLYPRHLEDAQT